MKNPTDKCPQNFRWLPPLLGVLFLTACGMTDTVEPSKAGDPDRALILGASRGTALFSPRPVVIKSVDGKAVAATADSVRVAPGVHLLVVTCYESLFARNTHELNVSVEAGRTYVLSSQIRPNKISDGTGKCEAEISLDDSK